MAIVLCPNSHYYDDKRNKFCPYCEKMASNALVSSEPKLDEQLTSFITPITFGDDAQLTEGYGEAIGTFEKTIGIFLDETQNVLTTGWLVCTEGAEKGKSYALHSGRNFAGKSPYMDIVLAGDDGIAEEKHFSVIYEPRSITFYLVCGSGHTYLNGEPLSAEMPLSDGDAIQAGHSKYIFIPFCKEGREWI